MCYMLHVTCYRLVLGLMRFFKGSTAGWASLKAGWTSLTVDYPENYYLLKEYYVPHKKSADSKKGFQ